MRDKHYNDLIDESLVSGVRAMLDENDGSALQKALAEFWKYNK